MSNSTVPISSLPVGVNIGPFADAMFVGIMLSTFLWGITVVQTWNYYNSNTGSDGWMLKTFVGILFLLDTVTTVLTTDMAHIYLIENFGNLGKLLTLPLAGVMEVGFNVFIVFLVELFFARRVYLLNQHQLVMPALITLFGVAGLVSGIFIVVDISKTPTVPALAKPSMKIETALCNTFQAISDLMATFGMSYEFYRNRGQIKATNSLLDRLLGFAVARGGLVTIAQFLTLALYVAEPTKLNWMPVHFMLGKLCHITMVTILNSRESMRSRVKGSVVNDSIFNDTVISGRGLGAGGTPYQLRALPDGKGMTSIHVTHQQTTEYDDAPAKHF
ncbi:hypothetical protein C8F04DRAFT_1249308 [Mycena alexandri]|uniref:DUF6534 domain-containing protein n=1 Tax=Mycena alexandri TaxID=1745969 RepID=A0AAD6TLB8_9AGAR|nr:hypothetical protein C8F04DRAFT_1249308 [Mycena alexandri]